MFVLLMSIELKPFSEPFPAGVNRTLIVLDAKMSFQMTKTLEEEILGTFLPLNCNLTF